MVDSPVLGIALGGFTLGLASGVHCVGMCGGIVAAFSSQRNIVHVVRDSRAATGPRRLALLALFNTGRVGAYSLAGAVAGAVGGAAAYAGAAMDFQVALFALANLMLVGMGLYLAGLSPALARLERLGAPLWRRLQPLAAGFLPADTPLRAVVAGSLWGWIPCGLVYGMLATAVAAGSAANGAIAMLAFGLGTLPNLMLAGIAFSRIQRLASHPAARRIAGGLVLGFGLVGLARAAELGTETVRVLLCL